MYSLHKSLLWLKGKVRSAHQVSDPEEYLRQLEHLYALSGMSEEEQRETLRFIASEDFYNRQLFMREAMNEEEAARASMQRIERIGGAKPLATPESQHILADPHSVAWCMLLGMILSVFCW